MPSRASWPPDGLERLRTSVSTGVLKVTSPVDNNYDHEFKSMTIVFMNFFAGLR